MEKKINKLTVKDLINYLKEYPDTMEVIVESDSYDFEEEFLVTCVWEENGKVVIYGN